MFQSVSGHSSRPSEAKLAIVSGIILNVLDNYQSRRTELEIPSHTKAPLDHSTLESNGLQRLCQYYAHPQVFRANFSTFFKVTRLT